MLIYMIFLFIEAECVLVFYLLYGIFVLNIHFNSFDSREKWVVVVQSGWTSALFMVVLSLSLQRFRSVLPLMASMWWLQWCRLVAMGKRETMSFLFIYF